MKNSKRMMAVIAAAGLAMGTLPGVANAQSAGLDLDLGLGLGDSLGLGVNLGAALGSASEGSSELPGLDSDSLGDLTGSATGSLDAEDGSLSDLTGSATGSLDAEDGSLSAGSLGDILGDLTGSASGSGEAGGSDFGSGDIIVEGSGEGSLDAGTLLGLGSLAAGGIAIGLAVSGGVNLPPLPEINVGLVCNLPQEAIDFLKDNGSMERDECEPEDQN